MNADTVTIDRIKTLAKSLYVASATIDLVAHLSSVGDMTPEESAAKINELMSELQAIAE